MQVSLTSVISRLIRPGLFFVLLLVIGIAVFSPILQTFFLSDSIHWLAIGKDAHFPDYFLTNYAGERAPGSYRPLVTLAMSLLSTVAHTNPVPYHLVGILLHIGTSFAVYCIATLLLPHTVARRAIGAFAALVFLLLPTHAEIVFWIAGYPDAFASFFMSSAIVFFILYRKLHVRFWLVLTFLFWIFALLSKENAVILPALLLILDIYIFSLQGRTRKDLWRKEVAFWLIPSISVVLVFLGVRFYALGGASLAYSVSSSQIRLPDMIETFTHTLFSTFVFDETWRHALVAFVKSYFFVGSILGVAVGTVLFLFLSKWRWILIALVALFCVSTVPILPLSYDQFSAEGERFAYFPSLFMCLVFGLLFVRLMEVRKAFSIVFLLFIGYCGFFVAQREVSWRQAGALVQSVRDELTTELRATIAEHIILVTLPEMHNNGAPVLRNGTPELAHLWIPEFRGTIERVPVFTRTQYNHQPVISWQLAPNGYLASPNPSARLYGLPNYTSPFITTEVWQYTYAQQLGGQLKLILREGTPERTAFDSGKTAVYYYSDGHLHRFQPADLVL